MNKTFDETVESYYRYSLLKSKVHYDRAEYYRLRHRRLGIMVVMTTSLVGTAVFASLQASIDASVQVAVGFLSVLAVVLAAMQTFLGFADSQSHHKDAAAGYSRVKRETELLRLKFPDATGRSDEPGTAELELVKKQLDKLDSESPTIPNRIWDATAKKISEE